MKRPTPPALTAPVRILYYVMPYVEGETLRARLEREAVATAMTQDVEEMRRRAAAAHPSLFGLPASGGR